MKNIFARIFFAGSFLAVSFMPSPTLRPEFDMGSHQILSVAYAAPIFEVKENVAEILAALSVRHSIVPENETEIAPAVWSECQSVRTRSNC